MQLKDRNKQIPNGLRFYIPELQWNAPGPYASFTRICDAVEGVVRANPGLAQKNQWPQDRTGIENWVEAYNAQLCVQMGWTDYLLNESGPSVPKWDPSHQQATLQGLRAAAARAKELVAGAKTLGSWLASGEPPVDRNQAEARAAICVPCVANEKGDWTKWFTKPAAELIEREQATLHQRQISTIHDERLQFCSACSCPLKLKVHIPRSWIKEGTTAAQALKMRESNPKCWVLAEL